MYLLLYHYKVILNIGSYLCSVRFFLQQCLGISYFISSLRKSMDIKILYRCDLIQSHHCSFQVATLALLELFTFWNSTRSNRFMGKLIEKQGIDDIPNFRSDCHWPEIKTKSNDFSPVSPIIGLLNDVKKSITWKRSRIGMRAMKTCVVVDFVPGKGRLKFSKIISQDNSIANLATELSS